MAVVVKEGSDADRVGDSKVVDEEDEYDGLPSDGDSNTDTDSASDEDSVQRCSPRSELQPSSSEWVEFNKKVISMRPLFKSAKVQFANKLSRQIKVLRNRKGTPQQIERCRMKADRLVEEIAYVNKLKQDIVTKFSLLHSKEEVIKIMNDPGCPMEYRVKAKVAALPMISKAADDYHEKHPDWRETLIKLIKLAGWKMKRKRRKMRGKGKKSKNKKTSEQAVKKKPPLPPVDDGTGRFDASNFPEPPPGMEDLVANTDSSDESFDSDEGDNDKTQSQNNDFDRSTCCEQSEEVALSLQRKVASKLEQNGEISLNPKKQCKEALPQKETLPLKKTSQKRSKKPERWEISDDLKTDDTFPPPQKIREKEEESKSRVVFSDSGDHRNKSVDERPPSQRKTSKANVDPFFMTSDDKEYKTHWKVEPADSFKNKDKKKKEPEFMFKNARTYEEVKSGKPAKRPTPKISKRKAKLSEQAALEPETLHPSWQAKKKLNVTAAPFQGKKIVFDD